MRNLILCLLFLILFTGGCENNSKTVATQKTCVVDLARLMRESLPGKDGIRFLEQQQQAMQKELDEIQDKIEQDPNDVQAKQQLEQVYALSQQKIQADGQNVANQVMDIVQRELNIFREKNNYAYIIASEALAAWDPEVDMTNSVLEQLEKQKIEFKPVAMPEIPGQITAPANGESSAQTPSSGN